MQVSVVIPTCNRKQSLLRLLKSLNENLHPLHEVIIVDSGEESLSKEEYEAFTRLNIQCVKAQQSVCIQRNIGIRSASSPWIFLCDDDLEVPKDYLNKINDHISSHPEAGAVSGIVLQQDNGMWEGQYYITSSIDLLIKYVFKLSLWGEIRCTKKNFIIEQLVMYYTKMGNHISKAGWPILTHFSDDFFRTPIYGLGASVVRKEWLLNSLYDEVLDKHGIGDNYGVAIGFPEEGIHVLKNAFVYHYKEETNRLSSALQHFRRVLALHYFIKTKSGKFSISVSYFIWSMFGNLITSIILGKVAMVKANFKAIVLILFKRNPYIIAKRIERKVISPTL